jgi:hypothetical protein
VQWIGHYGSPNAVESTWSPCAIENISASGAGTVVHGGHPVAAGERISLHVERIANVGLRIRNIVRHVESLTRRFVLASSSSSDTAELHHWCLQT